MCPACLCCLNRRTDLATGPDEIRVSATNQAVAINCCVTRNGIVRLAVTLRVGYLSSSPLALLLPGLFLAKQYRRNYGPNFTSVFLRRATRPPRVWRSTAQGAPAPSCGLSNGYVLDGCGHPVGFTLGENSPGDPRRLVGQGHGGNAFRFAPHQLAEPLAADGLINAAAAQLRRSPQHQELA